MKLVKFEQFRQLLLISKYSLYGSSVVLLSVVLTSGCTAPKPSTTADGSGEGQASTVASSKQTASDPTSSGPKCPDGSLPTVLTGNCSGKWRAVLKDGRMTCTFDWGPEVRCPKDTKPIGYEAVCYGATEKPSLESKSAEDCQREFGSVPASPAYTLSCCK